MSYQPSQEEFKGHPLDVMDANGIIYGPEDQLSTLEKVLALPANQPGIVDKYITSVKENIITIIRWETGSGKTTQVPRNIRMETWLEISVTQPRVISAISNSKWIAKIMVILERHSKYSIGLKEVWYRTWVDKSSLRKAMLSLNTAGLEMMRELLSDIFPDILVIDEAHQFTKEIEILMWLFKMGVEVSKLTGKSFDRKLVIMSATIDPVEFQDYFKDISPDIPVIDIEGRTFPVEEHYHEDPEEMPDVVLSLLEEWKSWMIFAAGKWELYAYIEKFKKSNLDIPIYPLHAELTEAEQIKAIRQKEDEPQRLIIATNVGQESITPEGIDFIADMWTEKVSYPNQYGVERLVKQDVSQADTEQRKWRVGRTKEWIYHRFNSTPLDDLNAYPVPPISKDMLDREVLLFLNRGGDLRTLYTEAKEKWESLFSHELSPKLLDISYERLNQIGAINDEWNITDLWRDLLTISLDVYHARMILQAIEEWCVEEMIYITCILSANGFIGTENKWKELFGSKPGAQSDMVHYMKMFTMFNEKELPKHVTNTLAGMWVSSVELDAFNEQEWPKKEKLKLHQMVQLGCIWIKNDKILEISKKIDIIQKSLMNQGIRVDIHKKPTPRSIKNEGKLEGIQTSLYSGYPFFSFQYDQGSKKFISHVDNWGPWPVEFGQANNSLITPIQWKDYVFYPFIIAKDQDEEEDDLNLATSITEVNGESMKKAHKTTLTYKTVFKRVKNKKKEILSFSQVENRYIDTLKDNPEHKTQLDYLQTILPLLVITKNHEFKKFIALHGDKVDLNQIIQDLSIFFQRNSDKYGKDLSLATTQEEDEAIYDIDKIEQIFIHDDKICNDFYRWISQHYLEGEYIELLDDSTKITSKKDFMTVVLPAMVLSRNHSFRKFLSKPENAYQEDVISQRLSIFFADRYDKYRTSVFMKNPAKTERNFTHNSDIYQDFRDWELTFETRIEQHKIAQKRYSPKDGNDIVEQISLLKSKINFFKIAWSYKTQNFDVKDMETIRQSIFSAHFDGKTAKSALSEITKFAKQNIDTISTEEKKAISWLIATRKNEKKQLSQYRKDETFLYNTIDRIGVLLTANANIDIDFESLWEFGKSDLFIENETNSQIDKYNKSLTLFTRRWSKFSRIKDEQRSIRYFTWLRLKLEKKLEEKKAKIINIQWSIEKQIPELKILKEHIEALALTIFDRDVVIEKIDNKTIDILMRKIYTGLAEWKQAIEEIVKEFLYESYSNLLDSENMRTFNKEEEEFEDLVYSMEQWFDSSLEGRY